MGNEVFYSFQNKSLAKCQNKYPFKGCILHFLHKEPELVLEHHIQIWHVTATLPTDNYLLSVGYRKKKY